MNLIFTSDAFPKQNDGLASRGPLRSCSIGINRFNRNRFRSKRMIPIEHDLSLQPVSLCSPIFVPTPLSSLTTVLDCEAENRSTSFTVLTPSPRSQSSFPVLALPRNDTGCVFQNISWGAFHSTKNSGNSGKKFRKFGYTS